MTARLHSALHLFSKMPLLITESEEDFAALTAALTQEIKPHGIVERMYVADIAVLVWEILRVRRCKVAILNTAYKDAVREIVNHLAGSPDWGTTEREWVDAVSLDWFSKPKARKEVLKLLEEFHLDESAIESRGDPRQIFGTRGARPDTDITGMPAQQGVSFDCGLPGEFCKKGAAGFKPDH